MTKSKAPYQVFSGDLETQQHELEENIFVKRFAINRTKQLQERYRPRYHFVPPENDLNDPNGLCFWQGNWHLFYQARPMEDNRVHWGHAISKNLIHWEDLPYAIYPSMENHSFSGSCFVEEDRVIAAYYCCGGVNGVRIKVSSDPLLLNWDDVSELPQIPNAEIDDFGKPYMIYDPCIWKDGELYYILTGAWADGISPLSVHFSSEKIQRDGGPRCRPVDHLFVSSDLEHWEYSGEFVEGRLFGASGDDGSCPYFWPIGDKHILLTFSHVHSAMYIIGEYDRKRQRLVASKGGRLNTGMQGLGGIHAPSAFPDGSGGLNCIYNVTTSAEELSGQTMSLPRNYTLGENDRLLMAPAGDVESLRKNLVELKNILLPANKEVVVDEVKGNSMEIVATIDPCESGFISLNVFRSPDKSEYTAINFYKNLGTDFSNTRFGVEFRDSLVTIDPSFASTEPISKVRFKMVEQCEFEMKDGEALELRIFIDRSIVEVFVNNKSACLLRVYPQNSESIGFSMMSRSSAAICKKLQAYEMNSIFK